MLVIALAIWAGGILSIERNHVNSATQSEGKCFTFLMHALSPIPSVFGRLVYLASLWNPSTGRYHHQIMSVAFGEEEANRTLRKCHEKTFLEWLCFTLEQQRADLVRYLSGGDVAEQDLLEIWVGLGLYQHLFPPEPMDAERELFLRDLEAVLSIIRREK